MRYEDTAPRCLFRYVSGSHAYGTERPDSDIDHRGVFLAPLEEAFRVFTGTDSDGDLSMGVQEVRAPGRDEVLYELRKFLKLAAECNPNIIEAFYVDRLIDVETEAWRTLKAHRHLFLSRKARHTFSGYAYAQLKRLRKHREYVTSPPPRPRREDFGLPAEAQIPDKDRGALLALDPRWLEPTFQTLARREQEYDLALKEWKAWESWEKARNPARRTLEDRFGYDTKHAAHMVRLLRMAVEVLRDGEMRVYRPDRDELRSIMAGGWTYERLEAFADEADRELEALYQTSPLPHAPDRKRVGALYMEICEREYGIAIRGR